MRAVRKSLYLIMLCCCAVVLAATSSAGAADVYWQGAGVGSTSTNPGDPVTQWNVAGNWNPSTVPGTGDSAFLPFVTLGTVYGGTATVGDLLISSSNLGTYAAFRVSSGLADTFTVNHLLTIGQSGANRLEHYGSTLEAGYLGLGGSGTYAFSQGSLHLVGGANLRGTLNMVGGTASIHADDTTLVDLSHTTFANTSAGTYTAGANSLTILAPGADPNALFGYFHTDGRIHTAGTTLSISPAESLGGCGELEDFTAIQGTLTARPWGFINLNGGVHIQPGSSVSLAGGTLRLNGLGSEIDGGELTGRYEVVGGTTVGGVTQTDGRNTAESSLILGQGTAATGQYALNGGSLLALGWDILGSSGRGSFVQTAGTHTAANGIDLGFAPGGVGSYDLSGGSLQVGYSFYVGTMGTGQFNQTGGTVTVGEGLHLGAVGGARGSYDLQGGYLTIAGGEGIGDFSDGVFVQTAGTHTVGGDLLLGGQAETANGTFHMDGGELHVLGNEWIGFQGTGRTEQTGGLHTVGNYLVLGASSIGTTAQVGAGTLVLTGGSLTAPYVGAYGNSRIELAGGTLEIDGGLYVNRAAGSMTLGEPVDLLLRDGSIASIGQGSGALRRGTLQAGSETLVVLPPGSNPFTFFRTISTSGLVCVGGTVVPIPEGETVRGIGELDDPVYCRGTMAARPGQFINLNAGARVGPAGSLNLGDANLVINDDWSGMEGGVLTVGGSLMLGGGSAGRGVFTMTAGSLTVGGDIILAAAPNSTGQMRVSKGTSVHARNLTINPSYPGPPFYNARTTKLTIELADDGHALIALSGLATLSGTLDVQATNGYRPRETDSFTIISSTDPNGLKNPGAFSVFSSNITTGLPGSTAFSGTVNGSDYEVTFLGYTAGDANGDHKVSGGDLSLMGGAWMQTGQTWATGDFNGDGKVDAGDLALIGSNWLWSRPPAPSQDAPLPEPATAVLIGAAWAVFSPCRRRARS